MLTYTILISLLACLSIIFNFVLDMDIKRLEARLKRHEIAAGSDDEIRAYLEASAVTSEFAKKILASADAPPPSILARILPPSSPAAEASTVEHVGFKVTDRRHFADRDDAWKHSTENKTPPDEHWHLILADVTSEKGDIMRLRVVQRWLESTTFTRFEKVRIIALFESASFRDQVRAILFQK